MKAEKEILSRIDKYQEYINFWEKEIEKLETYKLNIKTAEECVKELKWMLEQG